MRLQQATDYAFRIVLYLSQMEPGEIVEAHTIARQEEIPIRFLLKIMRSLIKGGIVKSYRGLKGGFSLARPACEITLLDVVEAVEGPIRINRCLLDPDYCHKHWADRCPVHQALAGVQATLARELGRHDFAALAGKA